MSRQTTGGFFVAGSNAPRLATDGSGTLTVGVARLDNREQVVRALGLDDGTAARLDDAGLAATALEMQGDAGVARLLGRFSLAAWQPSSRRLTLVRDYAGAYSLHVHRGTDFVVFASHLPDLFAVPEVPREIDETTLANFLALDHGERERTFYRGVERVPSRMLVEIGEGRTERRHYWSPKLDAPLPFRREADLVEQARVLLDQAVARTIRDVPHVAILTSGGLDSSAAAATAARLGLAKSVTCYTGVPPEGFSGEVPSSRYLDERPKVEALGRMHPSLDLRFVAPTGVHPLLEDSTRFFLRSGVPIRNVCNLGWFGGIGDAIRGDGHRVALNGTRGNISLTWSGPFSLVALARRGRFAALWRDARAIARADDISVFRVLAAQALLRALPQSFHRAIGPLRGQDAGDISGHSLLNAAAIEALDLRRLWREDGFDATFRLSGNVTDLRAGLIFDHNQIGRDTIALSEAVHGYEMRDPFADRDLVEFCLAIPDDYYRRGSTTRWFARQVLADRLPPEILNEKRRGVQAPNWFESLNMRRESVAAEVERLEASPMASRLLDIPRLKRLLDEWPKDATEAEGRMREYRLALSRGVHVGQFIRWVEGGNA